MNGCGSPPSSARCRRTPTHGNPISKEKMSRRPRIHDLRHTCASWLIQAGVSMPVVQQHLGHESISTTVGLYTHLDRVTMKAAADVIGQLLA